MIVSAGIRNKGHRLW